MQLQEMKLGKSLEIYVNREGYQYRVVSKIEDVSKERICVTLIASRTRVFQFNPTDRIDIIYRTGERLWKWEGVRGDIISLDGDKVHCFYAKPEGKSFNRRNAFRVFLGEEQEATYFVVREDVKARIKHGLVKTENLSDDEYYEKKKVQVLIKDISESGIGFFANHTFELKDQVMFEIFTHIGKIRCKAEIVRVEKATQDLYHNYYGCSFVQITKNITKYIYEMQRLKLQSGRDTRG